MKKLTKRQMKFIGHNIRESLLAIGCVNLEGHMCDEDLEIITNSVIASLSKLEGLSNKRSKAG